MACYQEVWYFIEITWRMICYRDHLKNDMLTRSPGEWYYIFTWRMACYQEVWYFLRSPGEWRVIEITWRTEFYQDHLENVVIEITWRMVCYGDHLENDMLLRSHGELFVIENNLRMICYRDHLKNAMLARSHGECYII